MTLVFEKFTAAQVAVDKNLSEGFDWQKSNVPRRVRRIGVTGSNAIGDMRLDIYYGSEKVMSVVNVATGLLVPRTKSFWHVSKLILPAGVPLNVMVVTAAVTNPVYLYLDIAELV